MLAAGLVAAAPLVMAALGEAVGEKSGLLNLGIEGMMLCGAFFGFYTSYQTGAAVWGVLAGLAAGFALGLVFAILTVSLRVDQVLVGLAITIFGGGLTAFLYREDRKSTRLNSSHANISYAVFCLQKTQTPDKTCSTCNTSHSHT